MPIAVERYSAQATIPAAALPVDIRLVPVDGLPDLAILEVDEVDATVALALVTAAHNRGRDQFHGGRRRQISSAGMDSTHACAGHHRLVNDRLTDLGRCGVTR